MALAIAVTRKKLKIFTLGCFEYLLDVKRKGK